MLLFYDKKYDEWYHYSIVGFGPSPYYESEFVYLWSSFPQDDDEMNWRAQFSSGPLSWKFNGKHIIRVAMPLKNGNSLLDITVVCPD